jgi:molybdopterin-guanine dinucleotide biosynthesis protein A
MNPYPYAVIFAGGKSTRMGKDKALLPFGEHSSLSEYQYKKLKKVFHTVFISAKEDKFHFDCQVISDIYETSSPLVGILSIFETIEALDSVFILSVDAPFVDESIINTIMQADNKDFDAIIAKSPHGIQPLCGLYKKSIVAQAELQYEKGNHKLQDLLGLVKTKIVLFEENTPFTNLNHPKEYRDALALSFS